MHDGNILRPHALLASGKHSDGFFNSRLVILDEVLLEDAALDLLDNFVQQDGDVSVVQGVVGPQTGATKLAEFMSQHIAIFSGRKCFSASPAKHEADGVKSMVFTQEERGTLYGNVVLLCEDVLTTGGSVELAAAAAIAAGATVLPYILVLVNRSGLTEVDGKKIIALIDRPMPMWMPGACPLCAAGSESLRPKDNWARLNATY